MQYIGGFFELELPAATTQTYHAEAVALNSARACLSLLIQQLKIQKLYLPFYTCDALIEPLQEQNIAFEFYALNKNLEPENEPILKENEYWLYINYFGLKTEYVKKTVAKFGQKVLIDNTQAFFERSFFPAYSFNSARKWFGVADGAYLYSPTKITFQPEKPTVLETRHLTERLNGNQETAYKIFKAAEAAVTTDLKSISRFSERLLELVNYEQVQQQRRSNYQVYAEAFQELNLLKLPLLKPDSVPFVYPLLLAKDIDRTKVFEQGIFITRLWDDVLNRKAENGSFLFEKGLAQNLLALPIDHRYTAEECTKVIKAFTALL
jgi:hypothetical protein